MNLQPYGGRVLVKVLEDANPRTASGLVIPDTAKEKPQTGEVIAVGPGDFEDGQRVPIEVKVGDVVVYSEYGGIKYKINGEDHLFLASRDILATVL
ncbi:MAG: co-chaperone GroES [Actinobacteria bacterium]|nr:co-chaperone GroES [Actinomycetota bacterium]